MAQLKSTIDEFREALPVFDEVANPAMRLRHWAALFELVGRELELNELGQPRDFTVRMLTYEHNIADKLEQVRTGGSTGHGGMLSYLQLARAYAVIANTCNFRPGAATAAARPFLNTRSCSSLSQRAFFQAVPVLLSVACCTVVLPAQPQSSAAVSCLLHSCGSCSAPELSPRAQSQRSAPEISPRDQPQRSAADSCRLLPASGANPEHDCQQGGWPGEDPGQDEGGLGCALLPHHRVQGLGHCGGGRR